MGILFLYVIIPLLPIDIVGELHAAQKIRDDSLMARLKLANQERDAVLKVYANHGATRHDHHHQHSRSESSSVDGGSENSKSISSRHTTSASFDGFLTGYLTSSVGFGTNTTNTRVISTSSLVASTTSQATFTGTSSAASGSFGEVPYQMKSSINKKAFSNLSSQQPKYQSEISRITQSQSDGIDPIGSASPPFFMVQSSDSQTLSSGATLTSTPRIGSNAQPDLSSLLCPTFEQNSSQKLLSQHFDLSVGKDREDLSPLPAGRALGNNGSSHVNDFVHDQPLSAYCPSQVPFNANPNIPQLPAHSSPSALDIYSKMKEKCNKNSNILINIGMEQLGIHSKDHSGLSNYPVSEMSFSEQEHLLKSIPLPSGFSLHPIIITNRLHHHKQRPNHSNNSDSNSSSLAWAIVPDYVELSPIHNPQPHDIVDHNGIAASTGLDLLPSKLQYNEVGN